MQECRIVVRWTNGEVEGLVGRGLTLTDARNDAIRQVQDRVADALGSLQALSILDSDVLLTRAEGEKVHRDWAVQAAA